MRHTEDERPYRLRAFQSPRLSTSVSPAIVAERDAVSAFERFTRVVEWPMAILALAVVPALVLENRSTTPEIAAWP